MPVTVTLIALFVASATTAHVAVLNADSVTVTVVFVPTMTVDPAALRRSAPVMVHAAPTLSVTEYAEIFTVKAQVVLAGITAQLSPVCIYSPSSVAALVTAELVSE